MAINVRRTLRSLNALVVLEAAARHRNFTLAAAELGVTQAAVSRQVAALEADFGGPLFIRKHRSVEPTPSCELLASSLAASFAGIVESVEMARSAHQHEPVTIGATHAFSTIWLLPNIGEFRKRFPAAQIRVVSQDSRINLNTGEADVVIRFGQGPFEDGHIVASRSDEVFPICSPAYAEQLGGGADVFAAAGYELIGQDVPERSWLSWPDWFARAGIQAATSKPALRFNQYTEVLQAARAGHGIALGWALLVRSALDDGSLVRLGSAKVSADGRYNVVVPVRRKPHVLRDVVVEWLADLVSR